MRLRVYDHSEVLAPLDRSAVVRVLRALVERWAADHDIVNFIGKTELEEFFNPSADDPEYRAMRAHMGKADGDDPSTLLAKLIRTPRQLRRVVRSAHGAWELLRGEVNPFEVLVVRALYELAPAVCEYCVERQDEFRALAIGRVGNGILSKKPEEWTTARRELLKRLDEVAKADSGMSDGADRSEALALVLWLWQVPEKAAGQGAAPARKQTIGQLSPTDYLSRIAEQRVRSTDLADQAILKVLGQWHGGHSDATIGGLTLPEALFADGRVGPKVEQFDRLVGASIYELASSYFQVVLRQPLAQAATSETPGFHSLWRIMLHGVASRPASWLEGEFDRAAPISLAFAHNLLHWWQHTSGRNTGHSGYIDLPVWQHAWATLERLFAADPAAYTAALDSTDPWTTWKLATGEGKSAATLEQQGVSVIWWADMLLSAARHDPNSVIPQLDLLLIAPGDHFPENPNPPMALRQDWLDKLYPTGAKRAELLAAIDRDVDFTAIADRSRTIVSGAHRFLVDYLRSMAGPGPASPPDVSGPLSASASSNPDIAQLPAELIIDLVV